MAYAVLVRAGAVASEPVERLHRFHAFFRRSPARHRYFAALQTLHMTFEVRATVDVASAEILVNLVEADFKPLARLISEAVSEAVSTTNPNRDGDLTKQHFMLMKAPFVEIAAQ